MPIFKYILLCLIAIAIHTGSNAQHILNIDSLFANKNEIIFSFEENDKHKVNQLSDIISIDSWRHDTITAYANKEEFVNFLALSYPFVIHTKHYPKAVNMASDINEMMEWNKYPTYNTYLEMMQYFQLQYSDICRVDTIGYSTKGRLILAVKISDNVDSNEAEPEFMYSSTIHGDEVTGYYLMLRLINTLLSSYNNDNELTTLINNTQIYINPLANPDGTYYKGDNSVVGSTRYNAKRVDLNRNYPDPWKTSQPNDIQIENTAMINYVDKHHFVMAANLHGGAEVLNYPWDSFVSYSKKTADYDWWINVCQQFINTCRNIDPYCFSTDFANGYVQGGNWYVISRGRQDYMNYHQRIREITMEVSLEKILPTDMLQDYWNTQHQALIDYIAEVHKGIHGTVTDSATGLPIEALIHIVNHDKDNSDVYSSNLNGHFYRPIASGTYTLRVSAPGYITKEIKDIQYSYPNQTTINVELVKSKNSPDEIKIYPNPCTDYIQIVSGDNIIEYTLLDATGRIISAQQVNAFSTDIYTANLQAGIYIIEIHTSSNTKNRIFTFVKQ